MKLLLRAKLPRAVLTLPARDSAEKPAALPPFNTCTHTMIPTATAVSFLNKMLALAFLQYCYYYTCCWQWLTVIGKKVHAHVQGMSKDRQEEQRSLLTPAAGSGRQMLSCKRVHAHGRHMSSTKSEK